MISHGKDIKIFTGNSNPDLAHEICKIIGIKMGESEVKRFADGAVSGKELMEKGIKVRLSGAYDSAVFEVVRK